MTNELIANFKQKISPDIFRVVEKHSLVTLDEPEYTLKLRLVSASDGGIVFRIEDFKQKADYFLGGGSRRAGGKDNDLTFLDGQCIYQFEVKKTKHPQQLLGKTQLKAGLRWVRHILDVSCSEHEQLLTKVAYIQISIPKRPNLVRSAKKYRFLLSDNVLIVAVSSEMIEVEFVKIYNYILSNGHVLQNLDWKKIY